MTYNELLMLLDSMKKQVHSGIDDQVTLLWDGELYNLDLSESLSTGKLHLIPLFTDIEGTE